MAIRVRPRGTRGAGFPGPLMWLFKLFGGQQLRMYRRDGGQSLSRRMGFPVVLLTTRGAKSPQPRTAAIGGFPDGGNAWLVVASLGGSANHPAWFLNMAKHPDDIWLEVGRERFKVRGQTLEGQERTDALAHIASISPRYGTHQQKTDREIPIVRLEREA
jgi:deazaflavin-dependent oxidoreductase (nitroreductase family)